MSNPDLSPQPTFDPNREWEEMMERTWTHEWPIEPGWYWFYGWQFKSEERDGKQPRLHSVRVVKVANGFAYICDGNFMYKEEAGHGFWAKAQIPPLPTIEATGGK